MLKLKLQHFGHQMRKADSLEKTLMLGKVGGEDPDARRQEEKGATEDEMVGRQHRLNGLTKLRVMVKDREAWRAAKSMGSQRVGQD